MYSLTRDFCSPVLPDVGAERAERVERTSGAGGEVSWRGFVGSGGG